jgi:iron complex transport system permease protein
VAHDGSIRRLVTSVSLLAFAIVLLAVWSLRSGAVMLDFTRSFTLLGSAPRNITMVVTEWRLPRVAMAILVGAALASVVRYSSR